MKAVRLEKRLGLLSSILTMAPYNDLVTGLPTNPRGKERPISGTIWMKPDFQIIVKTISTCDI